MSMEHLGVIGAGTIGRGVAHAAARSGHRVTLVDVNPKALAAAIREIGRGVRLEKLIGGGEGLVPAADMIERIECSTELERLAEVEFVIENVTEKWETKRPLYEKLDGICAPDVVFAANTSAIPITRFGGVTSRPSRVVGMHFMNPVPLMPMVEVIRGVHTSGETIARAAEVVRAMGKECIVVEDSPGFVTNRVMMLMVNEAVFLLDEGVAAADEIDRLFKTCFGHSMGPLETADLIGLDTVLLSLEVLQTEFGDQKYRPCHLLRRMVAAGCCGRKSGVGFYEYGACGRENSEVNHGRRRRESSSSTIPAPVVSASGSW